MVSERKWIQIGGTWTVSDNKLQQSDLTGITRYALEIGITDYIVRFEFRVTETLPQYPGETKFIITDADDTDLRQGERYRVDFLYGHSVCRITAGFLAAMSNLQLIQNQRYVARICVKDNFISVNVDGMSIIERFNLGRRSNGRVGLGTFCAAAEFSNLSIDPYIQKRCFVVMPFDQKRDLIYEQVIKSTLEQHPRFAFDFIRADKSLTAGRISEEIEQFIHDADVIVADITEINRNVFYELGLARAWSKKAILLIEQQQNKELDIPFDIRDFRCHTYEFSNSGFATLREKLTGILGNVLDVTEASKKDEAVAANSEGK
jgi:hypothetical protein